MSFFVSSLLLLLLLLFSSRSEIIFLRVSLTSSAYRSEEEEGEADVVGSFLDVA